MGYPEDLMTSDYIDDRIRLVEYAKINVLIYPKYCLRFAGTGADILYTNSLKMACGLFLSWNNEYIRVKGDNDYVINDVTKLLENQYTIKTKNMENSKI
jgi:hypothetical protein